MVAWYDPVLLLQTGIRVAVSTIFGEFADKREAIAAANFIRPEPFDDSYDYSSAAAEGGFWFDFMADTGDGWDSTFAMARLVSAKNLSPEGADGELPRGLVIVLGGDQVYPTASRRAYGERLLGPFDEAFEELAEADRQGMPDLYAVPGNHDWYDGLASFLSIFCRRNVELPGRIGVGRPGRIVAGRKTYQTRSYFALRLPGDWWLWATDSQLGNYVDQPQIEYFAHVARRWMRPGSKVILCVGQPHWAYVDCADPGPEFDSFSYLERLCGIVRGNDGELMRHTLKLVLAGDSHHYSRYEEEGVQYVTCGGGGAFLHPTHQLRSKAFDFKWPRAGVAFRREDSPYRRSLSIATKSGTSEPALFPDARTSSRLAWRNLAFAWLNPSFAGALAVSYLLLLWLLNFAARSTDFGDLAGTVGTDLGSGVVGILRVAAAAPWPALLALAALAALIAFADASGWVRRATKGALHLAAHVIAFVVVAAGGLSVTGSWWQWPVWGAVGALLSVVAVASAAALASSTIFGIYLLANLQLFGRHWDEAFSALRIAGFKSVLRMRVGDDGGLTIFPIGLASVPRGGSPASLHSHLVERPIDID